MGQQYAGYQLRNSVYKLHQGNHLTRLFKNISDIPKVSTMQTTVRVQQSQSITIFCETSGEPHVTSVFWTKNGAPLVTNATVATPSLTMRSVSPDDNGLYICNAQNAVGTTASVGVKVEVSTGSLTSFN